MSLKPLSIYVAAAVLTAGLAYRATAQTGSQGTEGAVMGSMGARNLTPFEEFVSKLKLDEKTQVPAVREIFVAAAQQAVPVNNEMLQIRQRLLNVMLTGTADEAKAVQAAYAVSAAKMTGLEAATFAKVYTMLKPNQQPRAPEAFAQLAGMFQSGAPSARGGQRRGGVQ